jgi:uncharacterized protein (TIGR03435 family)
MMAKSLLAILACCSLASVFPTRGQVVNAQQSQSAELAAFEVASVKRNESAAGQRGAGFQPGGRFTANNMTLRGLVAAAYGTPQPLPLYRVVGGPGWIDSDRFDIDARVSTDLTDLAGKPGWSPRGQQMLRALLAERFRLVARQEERELPSYALVKARSDGPLGSQIAVSRDEDCNRPPAPETSRTPADRPACGGFRFTPPERVSGRHLTMDEIARFIMLNAVDRPVLNRTGLSGHFNIDLDFTRGLALPEPGAPADRQPAALNGTSICTAVQEQLGLKLEPTRSQTEVVVIDSVMPPEPD